MTKPFKVDVEHHVIPMLQLVQSATMLRDMLESVDHSSRNDPALDAALKRHGCPTSLGASIADETSMVLCAAIQMLRACTDGGDS